MRLLREIHDPALGQDLEALGCVAVFDDLELPVAEGAQIVPELVAGIGPIGEDGLQPEKELSHGFEDPNGAVAILDIGNVDDGDQQKAQGLDQDMMLAALHRLAGVKARDATALSWS
jgi:hypothetical protein